MARKESINDQIIRLYREGLTTDEISKEMIMPKDVVPKILEKHMPDYATFVQPAREHASTEDDLDSGNKKSGRSIVPSIFGKGKKEKTVDYFSDVNKKKYRNLKTEKINVAMDEDGFVDKKAEAIASMLQKGREVNEIAEFFSCNVDDVKAVIGFMDEHFKRANSYKGPENLAPVQKEEVVSEPKSNLASEISKRNANLYQTGTEYTDSTVEAPDSQPVAETASSLFTPSYAGSEQQEYVPKNLPVDDPDEIPEMPSIDPIDLDALDKELSGNEASKEEETQEIPSVGADVEVNDTADEAVEDVSFDSTADVKEVDNSMSPMEKMRKFAEQQIALNNEKINELNAKAEAANTALAEADTKFTELTAEIDNANNEAVELNEQIKELNEKLKAANDKVSELQSQESGLVEAKSKCANEAAKIKSEIDTIVKENDEFKGYL